MGNLSILRGALASAQVSTYTTGTITLPSARTSFVAPTSFDSIASVTLASNADTMGFTSIPGTYKHLQIRGIFNSTAVASGTPRFTLNGDGASGNYSIQAIRNSTIDNENGINQAYMSLAVQRPGFFNSFILDIFDYADTNKFKTFQVRQGVNDYTNSEHYSVFGTGHWRSLSAITSFTLTDQSVSDLTSLSTIALYGIKA